MGWENGELFLYSEQNNTCVEVIEASEASFLEDPPEGSNNPPRGYCDSRVEPGGNPTDIWRQCRQKAKKEEKAKKRFNHPQEVLLVGRLTAPFS